ncbi:acyltransferase family protein [Bradyrhizobium sp. ma5]|uniref:acyltransferase family protein n=1 Tax=Bradyrhizobium sp. ma5 TaxID=3344828 RepID=UPI0035D3F6E8
MDIGGGAGELNVGIVRALGADTPHFRGYRPDIDGLRAVAVMAVIAYHAFPRLIPGGFAGVDIFFVISGYLITGIIHREMLEKRFRFANFYARRVLRIFPALIVVVVAPFMVGWFVLPVGEMEALGANIKGAAAFIENFVLHEQIVGYFDPAAERLPLLHLWSLGIEEQYYIVWPAALWLISLWPARRVLIVLALALCSFVACVLTPPVDSAWAFYSPTTRGWELLAGALLALWLPEDPGVVRRQFDTALAFAGLGGVAFAFWGLSGSRPWPGFLTLVPVLAAMTLIATAGTLVHRRLLSARPMVLVGLISYPLYLWHFPLIAFAKLNAGGVTVPTLSMCGLLVLSFLLAWLTYRFVERPIRFGKSTIELRVAPLIVAMVGIWLIGFGAVNTRGLPVRFPESIRGFMLSGSETSIYWRPGRCLLLQKPASEFAPECAGNGGHPLLLIWGDSYGGALYPGLLHFARERGYDVAQYTASACPPLIGYALAERPLCKSINDDVVARIGKLHPDVVILDATWGQAEPTLSADLPRTVSQLKAANIARIVLMGPPPSWQGGGLSANVLDYYRQTGTVLPARTFYRSNDEWTRGRDVMLSALSRKLGIHYISVRNIFCNDDGCLSRIGPNESELTAFDPGHLTVPGSMFLVGQTLDEMLDPAVPLSHQSSSAGMLR